MADTVAAGALTMQVDDGGFLSLESVAANAGVITLGNNAELLLTATVGPGNTITLGGTDDVLTLGEGSISSLPTFGMTVNGFGTSDMLVVNGPSITSASYMAGNAGSGGTLVLKNGTTAVATLALAGNYSADSFVANSVNATQTQIIVLPAVTGGAGTIGVATQPNATVSLSQITQNSYYTDNGTIDTLTVTGSGTLQATGNATIANLIVGDSTSGNFSLAGGTISTDPVTINVGGTLSGYGVITGNEAVSGVIIALGGTLEITGAISGTGTLRVGAGAALQLDQADSGAGILFDQSGNGTLILGAPADAGATITGFAAGATIDSGITGASSSLVTTANSATLTLSSGNTTLGSLVFAGTYTGANDPVYNDLTGAITACFAAGTHIATPSGEVAVENLKAGDVVTTLAGPAPVRWIGYRNVRLPPAEFAILQSAEGFAPISQEARIAQMPIRIARDAIAPDVPHRDLLVSPEHAIHIDGVLVPARHLVNGASITRVITMARVQYFHIELDRHGLLMSEGLASESWLDTGNRAAFENADARVVPHPAMAARTAEAAWANDAAAPLVTSGAVLARIREDLIATARANGLLTDDPDLRIAICGVDIRPLRAEGTRLTFAIPPGARDIVIRSRAACAREVLADSADVRWLGVSLTSIRLVSARGERSIGLADPMLRNGFHACEGPSDTPFRWTDGNAVLPPALLAGFEEGFTLTLEVAGTLPYPSQADAAAACDGRGTRSAQAE